MPNSVQYKTYRGWNLQDTFAVDKVERDGVLKRWGVNGTDL